MEPLNLWRGKGPLSVEEPGKKIQNQSLWWKESSSKYIARGGFESGEDGFWNAYWTFLVRFKVSKNSHLVHKTFLPEYGEKYEFILSNRSAIAQNRI